MESMCKSCANFMLVEIASTDRRESDFKYYCLKNEKLFDPKKMLSVQVKDNHPLVVNCNQHEPIRIVCSGNSKIGESK